MTAEREAADFLLALAWGAGIGLLGLYLALVLISFGRHVGWRAK